RQNISLKKKQKNGTPSYYGETGINRIIDLVVKSLGFKPEYIEDIAKKHFQWVKVEVMCGVCCESSGHSAGLFTALMKKL
ncbi:MAG: hypothetical protein ACE5KD_00630, partial [Candidatus Bathyarchaeia archaeon]